MVIRIDRLVDAYNCACCGARVGVWQTGWQDGEDGPAYCDEACARLDRLSVGKARGNGTLFPDDLTEVLEQEAVETWKEREA